MAKGSQGPEQAPVSAGEAIVGQIEGLVNPVVEAQAKASKAAEKAEKARSAADEAGANAIAGFNQLSADINGGMERAAAILADAVGTPSNAGQPGETQEQPAVAPEEEEGRRSLTDRLANTRAGRIIAVGALATAIVVGGILIAKGGGKDKVSANTPAQLDPAPVSNSPESQNDAQGWEQKELTPNAENRWLESGFPNIKKADSPEESREAVNQWLGVIKGDSDTFAFVAKELLGESVDKNAIFDEQGHSTAKAEELLKKLQLKLAVSNIDKGHAGRDLKNPHNTGLNKDGQVVLAKNGGVSGDTEAVIIETRDGKKMAVMHRCAQPVVEGGRSDVPVGRTDEPPKKTPKTPGVTPKKDKNDTPAGVPGQNKGNPDGPESSRPKPGSSPDGAKQPQKPKPAPLPQPEDTRDDATGSKPPAEEGNIPPVTQPPINDNGSADKPKTEDPGGF